MKVSSVVTLTLLLISMLTLAFKIQPAMAEYAYLTDFVQLTTNLYPDRAPFWSPDGSKIAYFAFADTWYRHIWVMNADGSGKTQLTFGNVVDESGDYSHDGTKIVFMRHGLRGIDGSDLMMMNSDGTNIQQLTSIGLHRGQPRWSNDGQKLAFYYGGAGTTVNEIHIMNIDGTNETTLVSSSYPYMNVFWSPDDTKLVYSMDDGIWLVNTFPPYEKTHLFTTSIPTHHPIFSPDGKYILYAQGEIGTPQNPIYQDLYLINASGNFVAQLTYDTTIDYPFDWSPDGQYIAFGSKRSGNTDIWRAKIAITPTPPPQYQLTVTSSPITGITFIINGIAQVTPYTDMLPEGSYTFEMPQTHGGYIWSHWLEDGDTNRIKTILLQGTTWTAVYEPAPPLPVGGKATPINIPMNKHACMKRQLSGYGYQQSYSHWF